MIPVEYDFLNVYAAPRRPGTVHASDTEMAMFFRRYLFQKMISVFEITAPENWSVDYFLYVLYGVGYVGVLDVPGYGVIPQYCSIKGFNLYYQPRSFLVTNRAINDGAEIERTIDVDGVLVKLTPDYCGVLDLLAHYADLMALTCESMGVNLVNSKLSYVFASDSKAMAETMKKMFDNINAGNPAQFVDSKLFDDEGNPRWMTFAQDLRANFIAPDLLEMLDKIQREFESEIGIPNTGGMEKKERLISDEVNANNVATYSKAELWLSSIQDGFEKVKNMFGIEVSADWRKVKGMETYGSDYQPSGSSEL